MRMFEDGEEIDVEAAVNALNECTERFRKLGLNPDLAGFLMAGAGLTILLQANRDDAARVLALHSAAMQAAQQNALFNDEDEEEQDEDEEGTVH